MLRARFHDRRAVDLAIPQGRVAVVAMVFHARPDGLHLCLGRRAAVADDPWSGDLAFPGGKADPQDISLHDTAARETLEEVGLTLSPQHLIGDLGQVQALGGARPLMTYPLIYVLPGRPPPLLLNHEFSDARWVRLADLWEVEHWRRFTYPPNGMEFPAVRTMDHVLWGYSLKLLDEFASRIGRPIGHLMQDRSLPRHDGGAVAGKYR